MKRLVATLVLALVGVGAHAQSVSLNGRMGDRAALLVIDGQPRTVAIGATSGGVKLLSLGVDDAQVEVGGKRLVLRAGASPVSVGGGIRTGGNEIVLTAGPGGHFVSGGQINGRAVQFVVDTGATSVALSQADADRIGLDWRSGRPTLSSTANGVVPVMNVVLNSVRVGDVEVPNVQAVVVPAAMPYVLLGNSFLSRFQMRRDNDVMRLERRP